MLRILCFVSATVTLVVEKQIIICQTINHYFKLSESFAVTSFLAPERGQVSTVSVQGKDYPLLYIPTKQGFKALEALTSYVEATGINQRLIVYPKFTHFPGRDKHMRTAFQLVGFDRGLQSPGVTADLADFEFKLCGLWQFQ